ncbi:hypothetical protein K435DRAFT_166823 [Dendrothele bispora CBS 962.96]|uniref:Transmembrane protein n=1 Tax=Dendrothele bispora (strain CBS 962.96) TaxID=1314807 RepID=A0A4S8LXD3_DENBC|nr:hypothetical protein K435DRAFT_166823 [Dendrothele bispora CBS 962.96]
MYVCAEKSIARTEPEKKENRKKKKRKNAEFVVRYAIYAIGIVSVSVVACKGAENAFYGASCGNGSSIGSLCDMIGRFSVWMYVYRQGGAEDNRRCQKRKKQEQEQEQEKHFFHYQQEESRNVKIIGNCWFAI